MKSTLLLVDDEERILRSLSALLRPQYDVRATLDPREALALVRSQPTHVIISDQRMPLMRGADLLRLVKEASPNTMRLLLTGYSELEAIVDSVNEGEVFRFINKPWDAADLRNTVAQAAEIARNLFGAGPAVTPPVATITENGVFVAPRPSEGILVVDEDAEVVQIVKDIVSPTQPVYWGPTLDEAFRMLERHDIGVLISELFVRREPVAVALKLLKAQHPEVVTIVMTPFQDTTVLINLINQGQVFRFLPKPVRRGPLGMNIASALQHHRVLRKNAVERARYAVQAPARVDDPGMAARVLSYLSRLRPRPVPG